MKKEIIKTASELRQDPVFGDWVLLSPLRRKRHKFKGRVKIKLSKNKCPFDNLAKFGNAPPVLVYPAKRGWFLQIIPNKYPAVKHGDCGLISQNGLYQSQPGVGFHEIVILKDHNRYLAQYSPIEIKTILMAYQERYLILAKEKCVKYISIFHNHGKEAGSTIPHPHSQILALPIIPPDINHSINGSRDYFHKYQECIHCQIIKQELKENKRIIYQNEYAIVIAPFASKVNFEMRIFPKKHSAYFEKTSNNELASFAEAMKFVFSIMHKELKDPAFNFYIHTAPNDENNDYNHYHWHMEILPKFNIIGSFELGTGLSIILVSPEEAALILKK
ncbi:MAG: HIT domain-containing protein [Patescibacteria group bacterium]